MSLWIKTTVYLNFWSVVVHDDQRRLPVACGLRLWRWTIHEQGEGLDVRNWKSWKWRRCVRSRSYCVKISSCSSDTISKLHDRTMCRRQMQSNSETDLKFFWWIWNTIRHLIPISMTFDRLNWQVVSLMRLFRSRKKHIKCFQAGYEGGKMRNFDWNLCCWCRVIHEKIGYTTIFTNRKERER